MPRLPIKPTSKLSAPSSTAIPKIPENHEELKAFSLQQKLVLADHLRLPYRKSANQQSQNMFVTMVLKKHFGFSKEHEKRSVGRKPAANLTLAVYEIHDMLTHVLRILRTPSKK